jgi:hypothetical protein
MRSCGMERGQALRFQVRVIRKCGGARRKPRIVCRDPVHEVGYSPVSSEFGGNSGADSPPRNRPRRTSRHRAADAPIPPSLVPEVRVPNAPVLVGRSCPDLLDHEKEVDPVDPEEVDRDVGHYRHYFAVEPVQEVFQLALILGHLEIESVDLVLHRCTSSAESEPLLVFDAGGSNPPSPLSSWNLVSLEDLEN